MSAALGVVSAGLMTTLQDLGRPGYQRLGIPVSGALDLVCLQVANLIVGNPAAAAALEIAYQGPLLRIDAASVRVAFAGGATTIEVLDGEGAAPRRVPPLQSVRLERGQHLRIGALAGSPVGYLAVEGGFKIAPYLGSLSTYTRAGLGGFHGRALKAGDILPLMREEADVRQEMRLPRLLLPQPASIRVVKGPQDDYFASAGLQAFFSSIYKVSRASDRMGMRLEGPAIEHAKGFNIVSDGTAPGSIQVPGNGLPIILLADRQTTGGYPKIGTVISADLPALGRISPGASLSFTSVDVGEAEQAARALAGELADIAGSLVVVEEMQVIDTEKLMAVNLVSGVVDAKGKS